MNGKHKADSSSEFVFMYVFLVNKLALATIHLLTFAITNPSNFCPQYAYMDGWKATSKLWEELKIEFLTLSLPSTHAQLRTVATSVLKTSASGQCAYSLYKPVNL